MVLQENHRLERMVQDIGMYNELFRSGFPTSVPWICTWPWEAALERLKQTWGL